MSQNVSERLRAVSARDTKTTAARTKLEADLAENMDRITDDLKVASAQADLLGESDLANKCVRALRLIDARDALPLQRAPVLGAKGEALLKRALGQLLNVRRQLQNPAGSMALALDDVRLAISTLERLEAQT